MAALFVKSFFTAWPAPTITWIFVQKLSEDVDRELFEGDLTKRRDIKAQDEIGEMATWFNLFMEELQELVGRFRI